MGRPPFPEIAVAGEEFFISLNTSNISGWVCSLGKSYLHQQLDNWINMLREAPSGKDMPPPPPAERLKAKPLDVA